MTEGQIAQLDEAIGTIIPWHGETKRHTARIADLDRLMADLAQSRDTLCEAIVEHLLAEAAVRDAKRRLAGTEASATMDAYASGTITGKNQAKRDAQVGDIVRTSTGPECLALAAAESALTNATISRDQAETQWKAITYQLQAMQAIVALLTDK